MSYFAIAAPQTVHLPDGTQIDFRVNAADTSQVEIHISGKHDQLGNGTWVIPLKRNGGPAGSPEFSARPTPADGQPPNKARIDRMPDGGVKDELAKRQEAADNHVPLDADGNPMEGDGIDPENPVAGYKSVNDDPVRSATGGEKISPVHGKISTTGLDAHAGKPEEGSNEKTPLSTRQDQAATGLQPAKPQG